MKNYFKKSHAHKPKKGKGSYDRAEEKAQDEFIDWLRRKDPEDFELAEQLKRSIDEEQQRD